jgi:hypothetical protein
MTAVRLVIASNEVPLPPRDSGCIAQHSERDKEEKYERAQRF